MKTARSQAPRRAHSAGLLLALAAAALLPGFCLAAGGKRILVPPAQLAKGQVLRYELALHTTAKTSRESMIQDAAAAPRAELSFTAVLRLEVLDVQEPRGKAGATASPSALCLRVTYERVSAAQRSAEPDASAGTDNEIARRLGELEGKSFECALDASGAGECFGGIAAVPGAADGLRGWLSSLFGPRGIPQRRIAPGARWEDAREAGAEIPLQGLRWLRRFIFTGEESCPGPAGSSPETCAVIRMSSVLARKGHGKDPTPEPFRASGLRTAGTATGGNESLLRISLSSGLVVSLGESAWQTSDVTVSTSSGERSMRTRTDLKTETSLTLLPSPR